jgi:Tetratricopeptide repeat
MTMSGLDQANFRDGWCQTAWVAKERGLSEIDKVLQEHPEAIDTQIERAGLLDALDRRDEAKRMFVEILLKAPTNFRALNEFGNLLSSMGYVAAACRVYEEATRHHPNNPTAHINLANLLLQGGKFEGARKHYEAALHVDPRHPEAHQGLGATLSATGDREGARPHFEAGFRGRFISTLPYRGAKAAVPLLKLVSSGDGNIPTGSFLDDRIFMTSVIVADFLDLSVALPPHQLIFNAIGDADLCGSALNAAVGLVRRTGTPVINHPSAVLKTARAVNAQSLGRLPHVRAPRVRSIPRVALVTTEGPSVLQSQGFGFPLLMRSPGFHTGRNFVLVNDASELPAAAASLPGDELLAIEYLDARRGNGSARKYRAMIVDGQIYPLHAAVSRQWKVHYFTADMADNPSHRSEDAAFLGNMQSVIGRKALVALGHIRDALSLDYAGVDFGLSASGELLLFEANATMVVNPPEADERWAYRRPAVRKILDAVIAMITRKALTASIRKAG